MREHMQKRNRTKRAPESETVSAAANAQELFKRGRRIITELAEPSTQPPSHLSSLGRTCSERRSTTSPPNRRKALAQSFCSHSEVPNGNDRQPPSTGGTVH